jgi:hypothetical protein
MEPCNVYITDDNDRIFTHENWVDVSSIEGLTVKHTAADINLIKPGDRLKICNSRERFYVLVEDINFINNKVDCIFTHLSTNLVYNYPYKYGDYMIVKPENIYEIVKYEYFQEQVAKYVAKIEAGDIKEIVETLRNPTRLVEKNK